MFSRSTRTLRRRAAAAAIVATAVAGVSLAVAGPASAAYGPDYGDGWVNGYTGKYGDNWTKTYDKDYGDAWTPRVPAQNRADVAVSASGPAHIDHNAEQLWTVTITNTGRSTAHAVRSVTTMPNGIEHRAHRIVQGDAHAQLNGEGRVLVTVDALKPGETVRLQIAGRGPSHGGGTVQLVTKATTTSAEKTTSNNTATVHTRIA
ncbi:MULTISPECIES: DUF11 domain-containing protein [Streptomyces]|uniref:DUF11 domain-containing protein n=1 Tax=Streptomyces xanthochromogenes TaxID=67384 RepID=A0ABQ2ZIJ9_9ACTN|nr:MULTISPECIES: DUF11 domain-containing protein [Streptomyces]MYV88813.1 hypothetical protein [Streptomyces sp. SID1034]GGY17011.1 hypothetical protein GCM10010326_06510 [Streptomyces xanthochromogenes]